MLSLAVICAKTFFHLHHPLSCRLCPIRPFGAPSPRGEGSDTRIPSSKKTSHYPCDPIRSPYRHPERSRGIFIALPPYAHMRPLRKRHLGASFFAFLSLTAYRSARRIPPLWPSLHARKTIASHRFSHRCVELCLSEALYPAPSARPFSKGPLVS